MRLPRMGILGLFLVSAALAAQTTQQLPTDHPQGQSAALSGSYMRSAFSLIDLVSYRSATTFAVGPTHLALSHERGESHFRLRRPNARRSSVCAPC